MKKQVLASSLMGGMLAVSAAPGVALATTSDASTTAESAVISEAGEQVVSATVKVAHVSGQFYWNQKVSANNQQLRDRLYKASDFLCEKIEGAEVGVITGIRVQGLVGNEFTADVAEYTKKAPATKILGCTCLGNPIDGRATANVQVEGFRLEQLIADAQLAEGVNTITFIAADGYRVSMPLTYVTQRYSIIVTVVNGEELSEAVGCSNQLWLGNTAARAYVQNIAAIEFSAEDVLPTAPGKPGADAPNVGVTNGVAVA